MDKYKLQDIPSGHDGKAYISINGERVEAFWIKAIEAKAEPIVDSIRPLGQVMTQNAIRGIKGTGNIEYYHTSKELLKAYRDYKNGGDAPEIDIQYYSDSPTGAFDRQEVFLSNVILASVGAGALDDTNDSAQTHKTTFTFDDFDII
jgi:hypothetical protein